MKTLSLLVAVALLLIVLTEATVIGPERARMQAGKGYCSGTPIGFFNSMSPEDQATYVAKRQANCLP